ncbi:MAG: hypothetical protein B1H04_05745, partial [Planctomycetales bacterium 4484_123]
VEVPFSIFGIEPDKVPALWGLNIVRHRVSRPGSPEQYSVWSWFIGSSHVPERFGSLWLPRAAVFPELGGPAELEALAARGAKAARQAGPAVPAEVARFDWDVFSAQKRRELELTGMVYRHLAAIRDRQFAARDRQWAKIKTWADWLKWRKRLRSAFFGSVGDFRKEVGPLNPRVSVAFENDDIRVERVIYESLPHFYVTANVYVPKRRGGKKLPVVIRVVGHSTAGRLGRGVIRQCVDLAMSGYFVLAIDALGQGERIYINNGLGSRTPTRNHYAMGAPCVLTGTNLAGYMIHDVMRGIDYLATRPEVDMSRIVMTGSSGGGTMTSYVSALEDRLAAAAPVSAVGSQRKAGGNYDSEQVLFDQVRGGFECEGRCAAMAPKPLIIICEVHGPEHRRHNEAAYDNVRKIYRLKRAVKNFRYVPTPGPHGYGSGHYRHFRRWLAQVLPADPGTGSPKRRRPNIPREALYASLSGRVFFSRELPHRETVFTLNAKRIRLELAFDEAITTARAAKARAAKVRQVLRELLALPAASFKPVEVQQHGQPTVAGWPVEKLVLETEPGVLVPAVLLRPKGSGRAPAVIMLCQGGKKLVIRSQWRQVRRLLGAGVAVLIPDVRATGETAPGEDESFHGPETSLNGFSYRIGTPLIGMRVRDVLCCVNYLRSRRDVDSGRIGVVGVSLSACNPPKIRQPRLLIDHGLEPLHRADSLGPALALLSFALDGKLACCATRGALASYASICKQGHFYHPLATFVPGILRHFDVPDLAAAAAPRPLMLAGSVNGLNQRLDTVGEGQAAFQTTARVYRLCGAGKKLQVSPAGDMAEVVSFLLRQLAPGR